MPPADIVPDTGGVDPHVLKAIAKAWSWRRKLERGDAATIQDIADAEDISDRYVGRMLRLAYLAHGVLERLLIGRIPRSTREITAAALLLGLAGYAWQGHPGLAGAPRIIKDRADVQFDEKLAERRRNATMNTTGQGAISTANAI